MHSLPPLELNETCRFPRCVEIQTTNVCNARCGVCPYVVTTALEKKGRMSDSLLTKLLEECSRNREFMEFVIPYLNNEPFADTRMLDVLRYIRRVVQVKVELSTNASLLGERQAAAIVQEQLVHTLRISIFGSDPQTYAARMRGLRWDSTVENVHTLLTLRANGGSPANVEIIMVGVPELTSDDVHRARARWEPLGAYVRLFGYLDRAGNNNDRNLLPTYQAWGRIVGCELNRPFERMAIRFNGDCVLCSQDWRGEVILGNVSSSSLAEIWMSEGYRQLRSAVSGRTALPRNGLCRRCKLAIVE